MSVEKNITSLQYQAKIMGHGTKYDNEIEENVRRGQPSFEIKGKEEYYQGSRRMTTTLNYKKGGENYFWNSYDATLVTGQGKETSQKFYVETRKVNNPETKEKEIRTVGFTTKEGCNLLDSDDKGNSRAVCKVFYNKEGDPYMAWKKLNLDVLEKGNHPIESYPVFDIEKVVGKHNFKEDMDEVIKSLCKGNLHAVTDPTDVENSRRFIAVDAARQDIFIYDKNKKLVYQNNQEQQAVKFYRDEDTTQGQVKGSNSDVQPTQQQTTVATGQAEAVQDKEPLLSKGTTDQSKDEKAKNQSKEKTDDNEPLLGKGKGKGKKGNDKGAENFKSAAAQGKGGDGDLIDKKRKSDKNKGVHV
ncbi:MAG: hypothetical protein ABI675_03045 [Chitinophagaceae bacterium]